MRVGINPQLSTILALSAGLKRIQTPHSLLNFIQGFQSRYNLYQAAVFKFEFMFEPLPVICQSFPKALPGDKRSFWLQIQWKSSWDCTLVQLGRLDGWAQTKGVSKSAAVAPGCDSLNNLNCSGTASQVTPQERHQHANTSCCKGRVGTGYPLHPVLCLLPLC